MENAAIPPDLFDRIYVYCTRLYATECDLRVRIENDIRSGTVRVVGPFTPYQRTVPEVYTSAEFVAVGQGLFEWRLLIPEPCFWRPESPFLYRVDFSVDAAGWTAVDVSFRIGLRHLRADKEELWLTGQLWRPKGALIQPGAEQAFTDDLDRVRGLRSSGLELLVLGVPSAELAATCSECGVGLFVLLPIAADEAESQVRRLRNEAAVLAWGLVEGVGNESELLQVTRGLDPVRPFFFLSRDWSAVVIRDRGTSVSLPVHAELPPHRLLEGSALGDLSPGHLIRVQPWGDL